MTIKKVSNLSHTLIVNTYEGFYYKEKASMQAALEDLSNSYNACKLLILARNSSDVIDAQILNESVHEFEPFGDSASLLIESDLTLYNNSVLHLKESHITFHTYIEDILENFLIVRFELHISSCSNADVFNVLPFIVNLEEKHSDSDRLSPHIVHIDYIKRGARYNETSEKILIENHTLDKNIYDNKYENLYYNIYSQTSFLTQHYGLVAQKNYFSDLLKYKHENLADTEIIKLKDFLIKSYLDQNLVISTNKESITSSLES